MAIESTESIDLEAQRAELEAVLRSEHFTRAPMLAHLLSFLCEKLFAGEAHHIKEYTVGVEVFHRAPSFDQNSDSIVRVEANRLRKRLAAYYAGDGASHRLRIVIPLGQYVPEFKSAGLQNGAEQPVLAEPMPPDQSKVENEATPQAEPKSRLQGRLARWLFASLVLLVIGLGCAVLVLRHNRQTGPQAASNQPSGPYPEAQLGPPIGDEIRILAGSGRSFVDHAGKLWSADTWFEGGTAVKARRSTLDAPRVQIFTAAAAKASFATRFHSRRESTNFGFILPKPSMTRNRHLPAGKEAV